MSRLYVYPVMLARTWRFFDRYMACLSVDHLERDGFVYSDAEDFLLSCVQCCWHVKDWIRHDESIPVEARQAIEKAIFTSDALRIVQAIATGSKHLEITNDRIDEVDDSEIELEPLGDGRYAIVQIYLNRTKNRRFTAPQLIESAMQAWCDLLREHGLPCFVRELPSG